MTNEPGPESFADSLKSKLDELEVERRVEELATTVEEAFGRGVSRAAELTHENRDRITQLLDRAEDALDRRTDGKYHDQVERFRSQVDRGVDRIVAHRPQPGEPGEPPAVEGPPDDGAGQAD